MENQHRQIKGYRELTQAEVDLMNKIKAHGEASLALLAEVSDHLDAQQKEVIDNESEADALRLDKAEPRRWLAMAKTDLQVGEMKLVRAVAQPTF